MAALRAKSKARKAREPSAEAGKPAELRSALRGNRAWHPPDRPEDGRERSVRATRRATLTGRLALAGLMGALTVHVVTIVFMTAEPTTFALFWSLLGALAGLARGMVADGPAKGVAPAE